MAPQPKTNGVVRKRVEIVPPPGGFKIDDDIPIPPKGNAAKYPFGELDVGQSFFVPTDKPSSIMSACHSARKSMNRKFRARPVVESGVAGVRIWRVLE